MADNGKWLKNDLDSAVSRVHRDFVLKWPEHDNSMLLMSNWTSVLGQADIEPDVIIQASEFCLQHLEQDPSLHEFKEFCVFLQSGY